MNASNAIKPDLQFVGVPVEGIIKDIDAWFEVLKENLVCGTHHMDPNSHILDRILV